MEDVCAANCKDAEASELLQKMRLYGEVKPLEQVTTAVRKEYQGVIDNLTAQFNAIKEQELTEDEIIFLNFYRERKAVLGSSYMARITTLETQLDKNRADFQHKIAQISAVLDAE